MNPTKTTTSPTATNRLSRRFVPRCSLAAHCRHRPRRVPDPPVSPVARDPPGGRRTVLRLASPDAGGGTHADHVFDGECPGQARFARRRRRPLTAPGDLRRVAITGSLGTGDSGENGSLGGRWRQAHALTICLKIVDTFRKPSEPIPSAAADLVCFRCGRRLEHGFYLRPSTDRARSNGLSR
jgi:hypothetical protein